MTAAAIRVRRVSVNVITFQPAGFIVKPLRHLVADAKASAVAECEFGAVALVAVGVGVWSGVVSAFAVRDGVTHRMSIR